MNQALSKHPWNLEVLSKIFSGQKGHFDTVLLLIYALQKKPCLMYLPYIPDRSGDTILRYELVP